MYGSSYLVNPGCVNLEEDIFKRTNFSITSVIADLTVVLLAPDMI